MYGSSLFNQTDVFIQFNEHTCKKNVYWNYSDALAWTVCGLVNVFSMLSISLDVILARPPRLMQLLIAADVECSNNDYYGFKLKTFVWLYCSHLCRSQWWTAIILYDTLAHCRQMKASRSIFNFAPLSTWNKTNLRTLHTSDFFNPLVATRGLISLQFSLLFLLSAQFTQCCTSSADCPASGKWHFFL